MAVAFVRETTHTPGFSTTQTITLSGTPSAGNALIYTHHSTNDVSSVTGITGCGATWTQVSRVATAQATVEVWIGAGCSGSGTSITVTHSVTVAPVANVSEWSGLAGTFGTPATATATSTAVNSGTVSPATSGDLVLSMMGDQGGGTVTASDTPAAFTALTTVTASGFRNASAYRISTSTSAHARTWTKSVSAVWSSITASFPALDLGALSGTATLNGTGSIAAAGVRETASGATLSGTGTLSAAGGAGGGADLSGTGSISAAGSVVSGSSTGAALSGTGTIAAAGLVERSTGATLAGTGSITTAGVVAVPPPTTTGLVYTPMGATAVIPLAPTADIVAAIPILRTSHLMPALDETNPSYAARVDYDVETSEVGYVHLWIGGEDVTYLRGVPTTIRRWESETPFGDTAAAFEFPQLNPWDVPGEGDLACLYPDAPVALAIVSGDTVRRVWSGFLDARGNGIGEGEDYAWEAKGTLWAAQHTIREPFPFTVPMDIGVLIARTLNSVTSRRWALMPETPIGIPTRTRGHRDQTHWEYVQQLLSEAWTDDGRQWTLVEVSPGIFATQLKPAPATVHATVAYGTPGVEIDLRVDESTRVDGIYARGIAPNKGGWANIYYPALELLNPPPYPNADPDEYLNLGTTDGDTDSGTGVTDWQTRVVEIGTFDTPAISGVMSSAWVDVAREVQASIGVTVDGSVGPQTWNATFDRGGEGIDMSPLRLPLAMKPWVWPTLHTATGVVSGANPAYTGTASVPKFIAVDLGADKSKTEGRKISRNLLEVYGEAEAFGTARWVFDPNETDRTTLSHLTNVKVLGHESEDRVLQVVRRVVELETSDEGPAYVVTTILDQRARDAMAVEDLLEQKRSAQADPSRRPGNPSIASRQVADQRTPWDSESPCGVLRRTAVNGTNGLPSVITVPFAEVGKLARIELHSTEPFAFMICASLRITENIAGSIVGDPFASSDPWRSKKGQLDEYGVIEAWGEQGNACGYSPGTENDGYDFTGDFILDTPVDYWTETPPYVSIVLWLRGDSGFVEGRFYPAYEGA